jgi:ribosomal protein S18 acetylase RimI-like enzyme
MDTRSVTDLYIEGYAEYPWSELKKCKKCGINYGKNEIKDFEYYRGFRGMKGNYTAAVNSKGEELSNCKKCGVDITPINFGGGCKPEFFTSNNLVDFWTKEDVEDDLRFCQSQRNPKTLVTEDMKTYEIVGFCWGYKLPFEKFPFLFDKVEKNSGYVDEILVRSDFRRRCIGGNMLQKILKSFDENQMKQAIVRTLTTSNAYPLFRKLDFRDIGRADKNDMYENRVYLVKDL